MAGPGFTQFCDQIVDLLPHLRRYCLFLTGVADARDDLMQSTLERGLASYAQIRSGTHLGGWMFRIARNLNRDGLRTRKSRGLWVDVEILETMCGDDGRQVLEGRSTLAFAQAAIAGLPISQCELLTLVATGDLSYKELAQRVDLPVGTVMSRVARARRAVAALIEDDYRVAYAND